VQVDPMTPKLKPPGNKRLKLNNGKPRSIFAFKFKLRRYIEAQAGMLQQLSAELEQAERCREAGAYTRPLFGST